MAWPTTALPANDDEDPVTKLVVSNVVVDGVDKIMLVTFAANSAAVPERPDTVTYWPIVYDVVAVRAYVY